jgi:Tfp pilus assembly protein PilW
MKKNRRERGFSMIELMVAMTIAIGLTGMIFYFLARAQTGFIVEGAVADNAQNFRAAVDLLSRDIQAAGSGLPGFLGSIASSDSGNDTSGNPLPDEILLLYGASGSGFPASASRNGTTGVLTVQNPSAGAAPTFVDNSTYVVYTPTQPQETPVPANAEFYLFTLDSQTAITGGVELTPKTSSAVALPAWSNLSFPSSTSLQIAPLSEVVRYQVETTANRLQRKVNDGPWVTVANNVSGLQFKYLTEQIDDSTDPPTLSPVLVDQVGTSDTNHRALIRAVQMTVTARTQMGQALDRQGERAISETLQITPRNLVLPGFVINR